MYGLKPVANSTQIHAAGYDPATRTLSIQFKNSAFVYHYKDAPADVATAFDDAESKDRFFGSQIKDLYDFDKVDTAAAEHA